MVVLEACVRYVGSSTGERGSEVDEMSKTSTSKNKTPPEAGLFASLTVCGK